MKNKPVPDLLPEYDFSKGTRGKYAKQFATGTNLVALDADVAKVFPDSGSVNEMLRAVAKLLHRSKKHAA
ncbi:MAG: hypothetical protein SH857_17560 [Chitinophagales bacterium]|nr:hypothetical protein [Chitinophagales bacterium]